MSQHETKIREMKRDDVDACADIIDSLSFFHQYGWSGEAAKKTFLEVLAQENMCLLVAVNADEKVMGFAWFVRKGAFDRSGYLRLIAVSSAFQRSGVGKLLLSELEHRFLQAGGIFLLAATGNTAAHTFYEAEGYRQVGEIQDFVESGLHERIYFKPKPMS